MAAKNPVSSTFGYRWDGPDWSDLPMVRVPGIVSPGMNVQIETLIQGLRMVSVASNWVTWVGSPLRSALRPAAQL